MIGMGLTIRTAAHGQLQSTPTVKLHLLTTSLERANKPAAMTSFNNQTHLLSTKSRIASIFWSKLCVVKFSDEIKTKHSTSLLEILELECINE